MKDSKKVYVLIEAILDTATDEVSTEIYGVFTARKHAEVYLRDRVIKSNQRFCKIVETDYNPPVE